MLVFMKVLPSMLASLVFLAPPAPGRDGGPDAATVNGLIARFAPQHAADFRVEAIPAENGCDAYELESAGGRIILRGNSGVAAASAFYHYLKEHCHAHVSWNGDQLALPAALPPVPGKIRVVSPVKHRMAYNYCTHGYTMPFWREAEWRRELDWLALHGINLALIIQGQDAVWQNTFARFGYSRGEMRTWLCSPVHQPWQFMQNMQGVLPPPQPLIDRRAELGGWIAARCRELGVRPVLQGYYGMVPPGFRERHPGARVFPQGGWAGANTRPDMLDPGDPMFSSIAAAFYEEQEKIFGPAEFYAADPFHEGGTSEGMDRGVVYRQVQEAMLRHQPGATLVKQCWQTSNKEMFDAGDRERSLALDLWADCQPFWRRADSYSGTPWGWCFLYNFGGNVALEGDPARLVRDFRTVLADPARGRLEAVALVPEGSGTNPLMYELMTEMAWRGAPGDLHAWLRGYLRARYGKASPAAEKAWETVLRTAYAVPPSEGPINSVITARPAPRPDVKGRTWSPGSAVPYDNSELAAAWTRMLEAAPALGAADTFQYDLADIARQVLSNLARPVLEKALAAYQDKDAKALARESALFLALLADLDELTRQRPEWLMGAWTAQARQWGADDEEKAYLDRAARMLPTTWVENPQTDLADYANREWNGLIGTYYAKRWKLFFSELRAALADGRGFDQRSFDEKRANFERRWVDGDSPPMASQPGGDAVGTARRLHERYAPVLKKYHPSPLPLKRGDVIGVWRYHAEGGVWLREIRADGSVQAYRTDGAPLNWFDGFTWEIDGRRLVLTRGDKVIIMDSVAPGTLRFTSEGFGEGRREKSP